MHRMPLNDFYQKCDLLLGSVKILMKQFFEITILVEEPNDELALDKSIVDMKKRLQEVATRKLEDSLTLSGLMGIIDNINMLKVQAGTDVHNLRKLIDDIEVENDRLGFQYEMAQSEARLHVFGEINCKITKLVHDYLRGKNKRAL
jgi:hypothetical protein